MSRLLGYFKASDISDIFGAQSNMSTRKITLIKADAQRLIIVNFQTNKISIKIASHILTYFTKKTTIGKECWGYLPTQK